MEYLNPQEKFAPEVKIFFSPVLPVFEKFYFFIFPLISNMVRISSIVLLLITGFSFPVKSQILKVNKSNLDADSSGYFMGNLTFDMNINNQSATAEENIVFRGITAGSDLVYIADKNAYILINKLNYFKSTGGPLLSTGYTHLRFNFERKKKLSYLSFTQVQYDQGRNMPFRALIGGGLKYALIRRNKSGLYASTGLMHEKENWQVLTTEEIIHKSLWKSTNYISGNIVFGKSNTILNMIIYYQVGRDQKADVFRNRISGDISLTFAMTNKLSFATNFSLQYEDKPIIPINSFVYTLNNGLKWTF